MPHDIGEMFFYGERPWHNLGKRLDCPANLDEALKAGGLDWEVEMVPIRPKDEPDSQITHRMAVVRKDRKPGDAGRVVGVVHPGFKPLQNRQGAKIFDALLGQGSRIYHTGGYLRNGEVIWLLAKLPSEISVRGKDVVEPYLLFTNSHDGSIAIDIRLTTVRVVCQNTLSMALQKNAAGKVFRRAHDGSYDLLKTEIKGFLDLSVKRCKQAEALFNRLAAARCGGTAFQSFLLKLMPDPKRPATADQNNAVRRAYETRIETMRATRKEILGVHQGGIPAQKIQPADATWWGALNTITGWVDHVQKIERDRYAHMLMGSGDRIKSAALGRIVASLQK